MPRAPKQCGHNGCGVIVYPPAKRCTEHTGWKTSPRTASSKATGTAKWKRTRALALQRDGRQCQIRGPRCAVTATAVDHVVPVHLGGTDDLPNAQSVCAPCHSTKTAQEAGQANGRWKRQPEQHPGLLP